MTRRWIFPAVAAVALIVAIFAAAPFVAEMGSTSSASRNAADAPDEGDPTAKADPAKHDQAHPRRRAADEYAEFRRSVEERRAAGRPTTIRELLGPDPPDAENAAVELNAALGAVTAEFGAEDTWPKIGPWGDELIAEQTSEQLDALRAFVERFRPFCDRVASGLDRPRCRLPVPEAMDEVWDRAVRPLQQASRILTAIARGDVDVERRLDALSTLLRLGRRNEPTAATASMVNAALAKGAVVTIRDGVERNELDARVVRSRLDTLLTTDWVATGPAFFELQFVGNLANSSAWIDGELKIPTGMEKFVTLRAPSPEELVATMDALERASRLAASPFRDYLAGVEAIDERARTTNLPTVGALFVRKLGEVEAACRLARVALAAAEHRATHGDFPASLDDLKPMFADGVPLDPFTDTPFVYEKTVTGVRIASLGRLANEDAIDEETLREKCLVWELKR